MIAGQDAEAAGVEADVFIEPEFQGKIGDQAMLWGRGPAAVLSSNQRWSLASCLRKPGVLRDRFPGWAGARRGGKRGDFARIGAMPPDRCGGKASGRPGSSTTRHCGRGFPGKRSGSGMQGATLMIWTLFMGSLLSVGTEPRQGHRALPGKLEARIFHANQDPHSARWPVGARKSNQWIPG